MLRVRLHFLAITLILLLAAALRINCLSHDALWGDEITTVLLARMPLTDLIKTNIVWENIPPLHHLILHFWIKLFGDSEYSVRMPSVLAGIAGVWITCILIRRLLGMRIALTAALLLAVNPMHIAYSQECRSYTISVLLGLAATDIFIRLLRRPTQRLHVAYVLLAALGLYAHLYGLFIILAHHIIYWLQFTRSFRNKRPLRLRPRPWIVDNLAAASLFAPWAPIVLKWTRAVAKNFWVREVTFDDVARSYYIYAGSRAVLFIMTALIVLAIARWRRSRRMRLGISMLLAILLVPVIVPVTLSVLTHPTFAPRYGIIAAVAMCSLAAAGIVALPRWLGLITVITLAILSPFGAAANIYRENWHAVADFLNQKMRPGDLAVVHARGGTRLYDYYIHRPDVPRRGTDAGTIPVTLPLDGRRVWLVHYSPWYPLNSFVTRGNLRIDRRLVTEGIIVVELTDEPSPSPATRPSSPSP
jgi:mannosyltransferase